MSAACEAELSLVGAQSEEARAQARDRVKALLDAEERDALAQGRRQVGGVAAQP